VATYADPELAWGVPLWGAFRWGEGAYNPAGTIFRWGFSPYDGGRDYAIEAIRRYIEVQVTKSIASGGPVWAGATTWMVPAEADSTALDKVLASTLYAARIRTLDSFGNPSAYSAIATHITTRDSIAPATPTGFTLTAQRNAFLATWTANTEADLSHYDVRYSTSASGPWTTREALTTSLLIPAASGTLYYANVRAVDTSGNASGWSA
jgi:hypothetical protein